ncbi:MAG TPA: regulatory iron-sulfur-containing complex subunit RicT [Mycobacteriales bacterium]|nr:regulatory iron-sulfur-containing complex subunit RicT [Mycobacteriales bacterium]
MAVSFQRYGRLYYFDPGDLDPAVGDKVLVPTDDGTEVAECVWAPAWVDDEIGGLPQLVGLATAADLDRDERNRRRRAEAKVAAKRLIKQHDLPMKVVGVDYLDRGQPQRILVYFSAPHRVDFRDLVRDLSRTLDTKVELRQLGARDEARVQGGIGPCGRDLCCATFLKDFEPVSVRMAKDQDLPVNPLKISGACGRLLCCLKYEHPLYQEFRATAPKVGSTVDTDEGAGRVVGHNVPSGSVVVRLAASGQTCRCSLASVCAPRAAYDEAVAGGARPQAEGAAPSDA